MSASTSPLVFTHRLLPMSKECPSELEHPHSPITFILSLTADERTKVRHYFEAMELSPMDLHLGQDDEPSDRERLDGEQKTQPQTCGVYLRLPRGTVLVHGDRLMTEDHTVVLGIIAKPESVIQVTASTVLELLKAAYHLGNRHVPLEITPKHLQFSPDPVLQKMMEHLGLTVTEAIAPFHPEPGAYRRYHTHQEHDHSHQDHHRYEPNH